MTSSSSLHTHTHTHLMIFFLVFFWIPSYLPVFHGMCVSTFTFLYNIHHTLIRFQGWFFLFCFHCCFGHNRFFFWLIDCKCCCCCFVFVKNIIHSMIWSSFIIESSIDIHAYTHTQTHSQYNWFNEKKIKHSHQQNFHQSYIHWIVFDWIFYQSLLHEHQNESLPFPW